jgi:dTDP-4-amino-4,6-dideoxygalactose transaminase
MDSMLEIAKAYNLYVIEDACQAHGAEYKGKKAGSLGDAGCFSFYPGKNLGAYGEGGAIVTKNFQLAEKIKMLRDHGQAIKSVHHMIGCNGRMDGLQAAVLNVKLKYLDYYNQARRRNAAFYNRLLISLNDISTPFESESNKHVYHIYALRTRERKALLNFLKSKDIHCGIHYKTPIHLQPAYEFLNYKLGSFPVAEKCSQELLSMPMYPELTIEQIDYVVLNIDQFMDLKKVSVRAMFPHGEEIISARRKAS